MRVLFVTPLTPDAATVRFRCTHMAEALRLAGHEADVAFIDEDTVRINHDVVVLHRLFWNGAGRRFHDAARAAGAAVIYGTDDLIFERDFAFHAALMQPDDPIRARALLREVEENLAMLNHCDAAFVSTEFLASRVRAVCPDKPVWTSRNFLGQKQEALLRKASTDAAEFRKIRTDDRLTLGYISGSPTHDGDLADIAEPLAAVLDSDPALRLLIIGKVTPPAPLRPFLEQGRLRRHPQVPWAIVPELLAGIDINLAPLDPTHPFVHAKSEIKFQEAAMAGVPTIAGRVAGFAEGVVEGEECLLAGTAAEWLDGLKMLSSDPELRQRMARAAQQGVTQRATTVAQSPRVEEVFLEAARLRPDSVPAGEAHVTRPVREKALAWAKSREKAILTARHRLARHFRLASGEVAR